jgi:hypothetical protein
MDAESASCATCTERCHSWPVSVSVGRKRTASTVHTAAKKWVDLLGFLGSRSPCKSMHRQLAGSVAHD